MTPFEQLHAHFCDNATELGDPPNVARLVRIIGDPGHSAAAATYRKYLRGDSVPGVEVLQSYARRWNESGRAPVEVVVEVRSEVGTVADSAPAGLLQAVRERWHEDGFTRYISTPVNSGGVEVLLNIHPDGHRADSSRVYVLGQSRLDDINEARVEALQRALALPMLDGLPVYGAKR